MSLEKRSVALFCWTAHPDWELILREQSYSVDTDFTRVTEWVEVEFSPIPQDEQLAGLVKSLDLRRGQVVNEFTEQLAKIDKQKAELLALPAPEPASGADA
jgi:hypothetical protein